MINSEKQLGYTSALTTQHYQKKPLNPTK